MARPKKEKELKREHRVTLRFTDVEYEIITENAKTAMLPLAEYARLQALNKKVTAKYEIVANIPELKKLIAEFGKTGSNLNQIAKHFNRETATGSLSARYGESIGSQEQETLKSLHQCIAQIYEMKYAVLKMAGNFSAV